MEKNSRLLVVAIAVVVITLIVALALVFTRSENETETPPETDVAENEESVMDDNGDEEQLPILQPGSDPEPQADALPADWNSLTAQQKTDLNPFNCNHETQWVSAEDGTCIEKAARSDGPAGIGESVCQEYWTLVGQLDDRWRPQLDNFWQRAAELPAGTQTRGGERFQAQLDQLAELRAASGLGGYDDELNQLRQRHDLRDYIFTNSDGAAGQAASGWLGCVTFISDCPIEQACNYQSEHEDLQNVFDLAGHAAELADLDSEYRIADFVGLTNMPNSTGPWGPPGGSDYGDNWQQFQDEVVRPALVDYRIQDYLDRVDALAADYNVYAYLVLLADIEQRYGLAPQGHVGGGDLPLFDIYDGTLNPFSLGQLRWALSSGLGRE